MATALARGFVRAGLVSKDKLLASDPAAAAREAFARETGGRTTPSNVDVAQAARIVVLAVKPAQVAGVLAEVRGVWTDKHVLLSIAAGVPLGKLETFLGDGARVLRVMPNTPALAGCSATAYAAGNSASAEDCDLAQRLFSSIGLAVQLKENLLDAVTGLSGSGPAYVCLFIEALSDGGVAAGLPRELATRLAAQTVMGAARMVLETGMHPGELKDMVASPGGTTIEGIHKLEEGSFRSTVIGAVRAAAEKSKQLGK
jgi:pyrroline-5-carboxylate reductase